MRYAKSKDGEKILPSHEIEGYCPTCGSILIAKCGNLNIHHWSHKVDDCDTWYEPESEWHLSWKNEVPLDCQEVVIGNHRADIRRLDGLVIELQHSPISTEEIIERELFYKNMIWLFDAKDYSNRLNIYGPPDKNYYIFNWKNARKSILTCSKPIFMDLGDGMIFEIKKSYDLKRGWGYLHDIQDWTDKFLNERQQRNL